MMLQRAASNAYSWWWASHIRTKQSKWLEQSLQDMDEKVENVLKLIDEEADSFAKRAEMYYKKRPEIINFVEESYRAFRALAQRYDHLSTELQNANKTIATVFPDQVQYDIEDEDEDGSLRPPQNSQLQSTNVPKVPKAPNKNLKGIIIKASKTLKGQPVRREIKDVPKSGLSKSEALQEIDKFQKEVLALQTVKEFVKSSYESGLVKYWEIENQIMEKQQKVFSLQDEFDVGKAIEDDEARTLMAEAALKSCLETLEQLQEKQERSTEEAREEYRRIEEARKRLKSLKQEIFPNQADEKKKRYNREEPTKVEDMPLVSDKDKDKKEDVDPLHEMIKEHFDASSNDSFTVTQLAERIDKLVNKVINLESAVSSQAAMIDRMRTETDGLQTQIRTLEDDKMALIDNAQDLTDRLTEVEGKLDGIQNLNQNVENQNSNLQTHFTEARCSLDHLSEKLQTVKPDEELEEDEEKGKRPDIKIQEAREQMEKKDDIPIQIDGSKSSVDLNKEEEDIKKEDKGESTRNQEKQEESHNQKAANVSMTAFTPDNSKLTEKGVEVDWHKMLLSGLEDKETILLTEYQTILRSYKDIKRKMSEEEKKNRNNLFEISRHVRELRAAITRRDQEIKSLRQKLNLSEDTEEISDSLDDRSAKPEACYEESFLDAGDIKLILIDQPKTSSLSPVEEKLRMNIDAILDENLDFWLRFSTLFHKIQKFRTGVEDLQKEIMQLKEQKKQEGSKAVLKSDIKPIYKHMREIQTQLTVWVEQSGVLKEELQHRFSSLCNIQEEIAVALKEGLAEEQIRFTSHQAAKLQGEILNMKQENNKVSEELESGFDHASILQLEVEKTLAKLDEEFNISGKGSNPTTVARTSNRRIPLRSLLFGSRLKKHRNTIMSCMHPSR